MTFHQWAFIYEAPGTGPATFGAESSGKIAAVFAPEGEEKAA